MKYFIAIGIVILDFVTFFAPLGSIFLAYVIITKPEWFFKWVREV